MSALPPTGDIEWDDWISAHHFFELNQGGQDRDGARYFFISLADGDPK
jgi:hypothetical protein